MGAMDTMPTPIQRSKPRQGTTQALRELSVGASLILPGVSRNSLSVLARQAGVTIQVRKNKAGELVIWRVK